MPTEKRQKPPAFDGEWQGRDHIAVVCRELADELRLLQDISRKAVLELAGGSFDSLCRRERKNDTEQPDTPKRPAPKYNKALKEAEQAAIHKPLTRRRYSQLMKEHVDLLPYMFNIMDSYSTRKALPHNDVKKTMTELLQVHLLHALLQRLIHGTDSGGPMDEPYLEQVRLAYIFDSIRLLADADSQ